MDGGEGSFHPQLSTMPTEESHPSSSTIFPESRLAHLILDGLEGLEIGPAAHNPFGIKTRNVGLAADACVSWFRDMRGAPVLDDIGCDYEYPATLPSRHSV